MEQETSTLGSQYLAIENNIQWPKSPSRSDQLQSFVIILREHIRAVSMAEKLEPEVYEGRLRKFLGLLNDLKNSLNCKHPTNSQVELVWFHQGMFREPGLFTKEDCVIDRGALLEAAATYIANPWLRSDELGWLFIDSLLFAEISAFRESILTGQTMGKVNWAYIMSGGDMTKTLWIRAGKEILLFVLRYILPIALLAFLYFRNYQAQLRVAGGLYGLYFVYRLLSWPFRWRSRRQDGRDSMLSVDILTKMLRAYSYCKPPVVDLHVLLSYLNEAAKAGAILEGALYVIIRDSISAGKSFLLPFHKQSEDI